MVLKLTAIMTIPSLGSFFSVTLPFTYGNLAVFSRLPNYPVSYLITFIKSISAKSSQSEFHYLETRILTKIIINCRYSDGQQILGEMRTYGCLSYMVRWKGSEKPDHDSSRESSLNYHLIKDGWGAYQWQDFGRDQVTAGLQLYKCRQVYGREEWRSIRILLIVMGTKRQCDG